MIDNPVIPEPATFLGELIATQRRTLGHSQSGLADQVCALSGCATVTRHEISRYEQEKRIPTQILQQATTLTAWRRRLQDDHPETPIDLIPGYLIHPNNDPAPCSSSESHRITSPANNRAPATTNDSTELSEKGGAHRGQVASGRLGNVGGSTAGQAIITPGRGV